MRCEQVGRARDGKGWEGHSGLRIGMQCEVMGWACAVKRSKGGAICVGVKPDSTRPVRGCWLLRLFIAFAATLALGLANTIINRGCFRDGHGCPVVHGRIHTLKACEAFSYSLRPPKKAP